MNSFKHLVNIGMWLTVAFAIIIQKDWDGQLLVDGWMTLKVVVVFCCIMALWNSIALWLSADVKEG